MCAHRPILEGLCCCVRLFVSRRYITASVVSFGPAFVYQFYPCAVMMSCATLDPCIGACSSSRKRRNRVRRVAVRWSQAHSLALARLFLVRAERECDVLDVPVISQPDQFRPSLPCTTLCLCSLIPEVSAVGFSFSCSRGLPRGGKAALREY